MLPCNPAISDSPHRRARPRARVATASRRRKHAQLPRGRVKRERLDGRGKPAAYSLARPRSSALASRLPIKPAAGWTAKPGDSLPPPRESNASNFGARATTRAFDSFHHSELKRQWSSVIGSEERTMASYLGQAEVPCQTLPLRASRTQRTYIRHSKPHAGTAVARSPVAVKQHIGGARSFRSKRDLGSQQEGAVAG